MERGDIVVAAAAVVVERQGMSLSVKDTAEIVLAVARLFADGNIILQRDGFTREAVIRIIISQTIAEGVPIERILTLYKVVSIDSMTEKQYRNCLDNWQKIKEME